MKLRILLVSIIYVLLATNLYSADKDLKKIFLANVEYGRGIDKDKASQAKFDAALNITCGLAKKYISMPLAARDSIAEDLKKSGTTATAIQIANVVQADEIVFIRADRLKNILRLELTMVDRNDSKNKKTGEGYAFLNYRNVETGNELYDPALLVAMQRAFAVAIKDSMIFDTLSGAFGVKPVPTLAICGIAYAGEAFKPQSNSIFYNKTVGSYAALESIYASARKSRDYAVFDVETRDTIYSFFNLFSVENCNYPTYREIDALRKYGINYVITGSIQKENESINLILKLNKITKEDIKEINSEKISFTNDDEKEYEKIIGELTSKLLNIKNK